MSLSVDKAHSTFRYPSATVPWRWAICGALIGLLIALLLSAPAAWLAAVLHRASSGQLQLVDARGTVWSGSARLLLTGGAGSRDSAILPGRLDWRLRPGWFALNLRLSADCCTPTPLHGRLAKRWGGMDLHLSNGVSQWPAALLMGLGTPWNTVQAEGQLSLLTQDLTLSWLDNRLALSGRAELTALAMSSRLSTLRPMGSYRVTLVGGSAAALDVSTLDGSLQLSGHGRWIDSRLRFEGLASAAPEHEAALANLLNIIGRRNGARSIITLG